MTTLDNILDAQPRQLSIEGLLAELEAEESDAPSTARLSSPKSDSGRGNSFEPGASVGHVDLADFRGIYMGPGRRPGIALVKVMAGWTCEPPAWPVSIRYSKLVEVT